MHVCLSVWRFAYIQKLLYHFFRKICISSFCNNGIGFVILCFPFSSLEPGAKYFPASKRGRGPSCWFRFLTTGIDRMAIFVPQEKILHGCRGFLPPQDEACYQRQCLPSARTRWAPGSVWLCSCPNCQNLLIRHWNTGYSSIHLLPCSISASLYDHKALESSSSCPPSRSCLSVNIASVCCV